ncbi:hypothetical protein HN51_003600 [Arachis hypogaea]|uniref:Bifunctional inhibitor/plant lipid transfer protein/seed storage helical domain-containing protein n=1 Tax=Arachis hypogaea TaxID=3818 RepID=A0A445DKT3_ARAHY|nr:protein YLS3 [Arachis hypogaea]QHO36824.1 hypothetical protein DS421_4g106540 [Arachis hypogaea]QHO37106.1 hypothetical protein DS421_4g108710 [Arachis hypogaea]RYR63646.1 hypothetical protein Ahy_A04g021425 [Arachis hypogaea]
MAVMSDLRLCCSILVLLVGFARCDLAKDRDECAEKLIGLAPCIPYVSGQAKIPTIDCCSGLKVVLDQSKKCICILIKDRNDPNLGITINATLALQLPISCHAPSNISQCVDLLHLPPNSPDAKVFEGFGKSTKTNTSTPVSSGGAKNGTSSSAQEKSDGGKGNRWHVTGVICVILPTVFISNFYLI